MFKKKPKMMELMTIIMLKELEVFHLGNIDIAMIDVVEYMGIE